MQLRKIINTILKTTKMEKQLKLTNEAALRLYPSAAPEFKELLEQNFGKDFFSQDICDRIKDYKDILSISHVDETADNVQVKGFDEAENKVVSAFIKKMRIAKVYRQGHTFKRGEQRWYPYFDVASGFALDGAFYDCTRMRLRVRLLAFALKMKSM